MRTTYFLLLLCCMHGTMYGDFSLSDWTALCLSVHRNNMSADETPLTRECFFSALQSAQEVMAAQLQHPPAWRNPKLVPFGNWLPTNPTPLFSPFVEHIIVPPDRRIAIWGNLHGNISGLLGALNTLREQDLIDESFRLTSSKLHLLFLGGYGNHEGCGLELLYTLLRLKSANPYQVTLIRNNIESFFQTMQGSFTEEIRQKLAPCPQHDIDRVYKLFEYIPMVCYIGCSNGNTFDYVRACPSGIDAEYDPRPLLLSNPRARYDYISTFHGATIQPGRAQQANEVALNGTLAVTIHMHLHGDQHYFKVLQLSPLYKDWRLCDDL